jgi:hypothetical protein
MCDPAFVPSHRPAEDDQIGKRLDYITYQWHSGVCSDDTIIQHVLRALHSHADTQRESPLPASDLSAGRGS